jgi:hypothetical protein
MVFFAFYVCRLDIGEGKDVDLAECPRALLKKQCIRYLGPVRLFYTGRYPYFQIILFL